jgi:NAD(P)-dependent dehydrogenase (short-subunit alcohol dehydrogenase family)
MALREKTAVVTGAGQGIGFGIAKMFANNGYNVVVSDLDYGLAGKASTEISQNGSEVLGVKCDVSKKEEAEDLLVKTISRYKKIDVLVNNAGVYPFKKFEEITASDFDLLMNVNLRGTILCSQVAIKEMKAGAKIINISSIAAFVGFENLAHYCATKGGIVAMTRAMALEFAPKGINVNAIAPGVIDTPGVKAGLDEETRGKTITSLPLKRLGTPEDIAGAALFLASDHANYITGQTIVVDGGYTLR